MNKNFKKICIILIIFIFFIFCIQITYEIKLFGNNISNRTDELIENILNISSYEAKVEVTINSNKTTNKYALEQYYKSPSYSKQIVKEPANLENLEIIYNENKLEIKNTNLGLSKIYENYNYLNNNLLWLNYYLDSCDLKYEIEKDESELIIITKLESYNYKCRIYIDKQKKVPTKVYILDNNNENKIYIEYKEIKLNSIQENNIFAFKFESIKDEV